MKRMISKPGIMMVGVAILAMLLSVNTAFADFTIIERPDNADYIAVNAINNNGEVVGFYQTFSEENGMSVSGKAFKWLNGVLETLESQEGKNYCMAFDINDNGDVVGFCGNMTEEGWIDNISPCLWTDGELTDLSGIIGPESTAYGINNSGHITGDIMTDSGQRAFLLRGEELIELGVLWLSEWGFGLSMGTAINENDHIAGMSMVEDFMPRAIKWTEDDGMINLGVLEGYELSWGDSINDNGDVIGRCGNWRYDEPFMWVVNTRAFLYTADEGMTDLGTLPDKTVSDPMDINNQRVIVGFSANETDDGNMVDLTACIWREGEIVPLSDITGVPDLGTADGINELGQITGTAFSPELGQYAFLWTPGLEIDVRIDIIPGSPLNRISSNSLGLIPVAVFGNSDLNVRDIDIESLRLQKLLEIETMGKEGKPPVRFRDINRDGYEDLTALFKNQKGVFSSEDTTGIMTGNLNNGTPIRGTDSICIVP